MCNSFIKKFFVSILIVSAIYFFAPLPDFFLRDVTASYDTEPPVPFVKNAERCKSQTFYVSLEDETYIKDEGINYIADDNCTKLQENLIEAIVNDNTENVRRLLAEGANANTPAYSPQQSHYPIVTASHRGNPVMLKLLLDNGADINQRQCCCMSCARPLPIVTQSENADAVKFLLSKNADWNVYLEYKPKYFKPFDIAAVRGNSQIMNLYDNNCGYNISCRLEIRAKRLGYFLANPFIHFEEH